MLLMLATFVPITIVKRNATRPISLALKSYQAGIFGMSEFQICKLSTRFYQI